MRTFWHRIILVLLLAVVMQLVNMNCVAFAQQYNEAPKLSNLVNEGKLPPVHERLPENPAVVPVVEEIGKYGGTLRTGILGPGQYGSVGVVFAEALLHTSDDGSWKPNIAEEWEFSEDGRECTVRLRKGIRWSDGEPFTAEDIIFWYEDMILNEDLTPAKPGFIDKYEGQLVKIDSYTIKYVFPKPTPILVMRELLRNWDMVALPKHYLQQFHPRYRPIEELDDLAKKQGYEDWAGLFSYMGIGIQARFTNPDLPVLGPWKVENVNPAQITFDRNPYYWKTDSANNQLPYVDRVVVAIISDAQIYTLKAMQGELDYTHGSIIGLPDYPAMKEGEKKGNYRVLLWDVPAAAHPGLIPNQGHKDPVLRALFQNRNFRIALSLAINREEINEVVALGLSRPLQVTALAETLYKEEYARSFTDYDPEKANALLDEIRLTRDKSGFRLRPDGKTLTVLLEPPSDYAPVITACELIVRHLEAIGIKAILKPIDRTLFNVRHQAGEFDILPWSIGECMLPMITGDGVYAYMFPVTYQVGVELLKWISTNGEEGAEPPQYMKDGVRLYHQVLTTSDEQERVELQLEMLRLQAENLTCIGTIAFPPRPVIVRNHVRNFPGNLNWVYELFYERAFHMEQVFIEN